MRRRGNKYVFPVPNTAESKNSQSCNSESNERPTDLEQIYSFLGENIATKSNTWEEFDSFGAKTLAKKRSPERP